MTRFFERRKTTLHREHEIRIPRDRLADLPAIHEGDVHGVPIHEGTRHRRSWAREGAVTTARILGAASWASSRGGSVPAVRDYRSPRRAASTAQGPTDCARCPR